MVRTPRSWSWSRLARDRFTVDASRVPSKDHLDPAERRPLVDGPIGDQAAERRSQRVAPPRRAEDEQLGLPRAVGGEQQLRGRRDLERLGDEVRTAVAG